jgi:hypothetical protein
LGFEFLGYVISTYIYTTITITITITRISVLVRVVAREKWNMCVCVDAVIKNQGP